MKLLTMILAVAMPLGSVMAGPAGSEPSLLGTQQVVRVGNEVRLPGLRILGGAQPAVIASGRVANTNGVLEFVAVEPDSREYESLLALQCRPSALKFGLLLIGCKEGATNGTPLNIEVQWESGGKTNRVPVASWLVNRSTNQSPQALPFFFSGSEFTRSFLTSNIVFRSDLEQAHIALWWQPSVMINVHGDHGNPYRNDAQGFAVNTKQTPPVGTPVELILRKRE